MKKARTWTFYRIIDLCVGDVGYVWGSDPTLNLLIFKGLRVLWGCGGVFRNILYIGFKCVCLSKTVYQCADAYILIERPHNPHTPTTALKPLIYKDLRCGG